jgi:hypothetical protein
MGGNPDCRMEFNSLSKAIDALNNRENVKPLCYGGKPFSIDIFTNEGGVRGYIADDLSILHYVFSNIKTDIFCYNIAEKNKPDEWVSLPIYELATGIKRAMNMEEILLPDFD